MNELMNAIIKLVSGIKVISDWGSNANRSPAPEITGIANKKENLAAFYLTFLKPMLCKL